ncbi:hypothetical protein V495_06617 [Pseudogymnoascus sp. VKM F-4514 (FW-929)]|nr:hypothetical protein V495_06617 [Pseudogymnoascus sp. VKM F-4514 (FW-929)]KFY62140.1 hypothetical protein V497_02550 [Pseudogymnoascus sp. VKM F-4516 (FW-969)]
MAAHPPAEESLPADETPAMATKADTADKSTAHSSHSPSPLPLSRTCQNCAHAKIKCTRVNHAHICDRCHRLNKECVFRQAKRRHNGSKKDVRIEALEAKVNQLLGATSQGSTPQPTKSTPPELLNYSFGIGRSTPAVSSNTGKDVIDEEMLDMEAASRYLEIFRTVMVHRFPFVVISPTVTAQELRESKPFLFLTVLAAASYENMPLQRKLGKEVKKVVSHRMIVGGEVSLEILQGILVYLAWSHYYTRPRIYTQLLQLGISIVVDLRLNRPPPCGLPKIGLTLEMDGGKERNYRTAWDQDEKRAVAGCFYLASSIACMLQKTSTFPFSANIDEYCKSLRNEATCPTDKYLLYVVRLQAIAEKIDSLFSQRVSELNPESTIELFVKQLQSELELFRERLPFDMTESYLLAMQYRAVELNLYQIALLDRSPESEVPRVVPSSSWRLDILCAGLISAKSLLSYFLSVPARTQLAFSNSEWIQIGVAMIVASKLSVATRETTAARETLGLRESLGMLSFVKEAVVAVSQLATQVVDAEGRRDIFYHYWKRGKLIQNWYEKHSPKPGSVQLPLADFNGYYGDGSQPSSSSYTPQIPQQPGDFFGIDMGAENLDNILQADMEDIQLSAYVPEMAMDGIMADWMSYPLLPF